jgi:hypothetical protein
MYDINILDVFKVLVLVYILLISWINYKYLTFVDNPFVKIFWIASIVIILLIVDIVLAIILGIAFIITLLRVDSKSSLMPLPTVPVSHPVIPEKKIEESREPDHKHNITYDNSKKAKCSPIITNDPEKKWTQEEPAYVYISKPAEAREHPLAKPLPQTDQRFKPAEISMSEADAHNALQKYVVDDYLEKASADAIIPDNYNVFPNPLGLQYNIQGIEKDIVGYDYTD